jgi:glutamate dehydrogenase
MTQTDVPALAPDLGLYKAHELDPDSAVARAIALRPDRASMIDAYFRHVPTEDQPKTAQDVLGIVDGHWRVGQHRAPGEVKIRVFNPAPSGTEGAAGWTDTKTVIDIVTDDMPSLVDSVIGALTINNVTVHRVLHPILISTRDQDGVLQEVTGESGWSAESSLTFAESWMHILIDRLSDAERAEAIEDKLRHALDYVRAVVGDAGARPAPLPGGAGPRPGRGLLPRGGSALQERSRARAPRQA